ncbi:2OG-Fe(II) oxygenase family protein [Pseudohaliea sp.]|uniref:2OG-Fe(II) oxygenase family protein n=1 Tax=Pseudohaliea sp. TaxID=2740289 RepID=UPI0032EAD613
MTVAIVDFSAPEPDRAFVQALRESGFAVLRRPPLDAARLARMEAGWREFFLRDEAGSEGKAAWLAEENPVSGNTTGWIPPEVSETAVGHGVKDLKEFYHIAPGAKLPPALAADAFAHLDEALALGARLLGWIDAHCREVLPRALHGRLARSLSREHSLLRILHYPPLAGGEAPGAVRAAAHEDINLLTVLPVSREPGLEIRARAGGWEAVPGEPGDVIINAGDMLQEATGGALPSTTHRVVNPSDPAMNVSRIAMPYFLAPDLELRLSARYTAGSYLRERLEALAR